MDSLRRKGVAEDAADSLTREIATGLLAGRLPPSRNLAALLGVSRPTLLQALQLLLARGLIEQSGPRRSFCVARTAVSANRQPEHPARQRQALYLLDREVVRHDAFKILLLITMRLHGRGWQVSSLQLNFGHDEFRPRQWQRAIEGFQPDKVIVWSGRPRLAEWLQKAGIPALFLGGDSASVPVPVIGTSATQAVEFILEELFRHGHERIWLPLCNRPEGYSGRLRDSMAAVFARHGAVFSPRLQIPESAYRGPEVITAMFEEARRHLRPTALVFHDWREYLAVTAVLRREGLDIPRDLTIALLSDDPEMAWHQPELAHIRVPISRLANTCIGWLASGESKHLAGWREFAAEWVPGKSIAPPPTQ